MVCLIKSKDSIFPQIIILGLDGQGNLPILVLKGNLPILFLEDTLPILVLR